MRNGMCAISHNLYYVKLRLWRRPRDAFPGGVNRLSAERRTPCKSRPGGRSIAATSMCSPCHGIGVYASWPGRSGIRVAGSRRLDMAVSRVRCAPRTPGDARVRGIGLIRPARSRASNCGRRWHPIEIEPAHAAAGGTLRRSDGLAPSRRYRRTYGRREASISGPHLPDRAARSRRRCAEACLGGAENSCSTGLAPSRRCRRTSGRRAASISRPQLPGRAARSAGRCAGPRTRGGPWRCRPDPGHWGKSIAITTRMAGSAIRNAASFRFHESQAAPGFRS